MDPLTTTALVSASVRSLELIVEKMHSKVGTAAKQKLAAWRARRGLRTAFEKMYAVRKVKTIWQIDKEVDLLDFYYPTRVLFDGKKTDMPALSTLPAAHYLFTGTAGQGKSIFLRYLCTAELAAGNRFPLFIQMRRLDDKSNLLDLALSAALDLGLELDAETFGDICSHGLCVLMVDGFDEVPDKLRSRTVADIESLATRYSEMSIVATSRPNSGIEQSAHLRVVPLVPLEATDLPHIIRRLTADEKLTQQIISAVNSKRGIRALLTTPLLVTLLLITYKAEQTIPDSMSDFYEGLFDLMLSRHDKTKPGYLRPRACGLGNKAMEEIFDSFCFTTKKDGKVVLTSDDAFRAAKAALSHTGHDSDAEKFVEDISKITCLLVEEGRLLHFVHKSVQEFHSARFLRSLPDDVLSQFYERLLKVGWRDWKQELLFLRELDRLRFAKYFAIPDLEHVLSGYSPTADIDGDMIARACGNCSIAIDGDGDLVHYAVGDRGWFVDEHFHVVMGEMNNVSFDPKRLPNTKSSEALDPGAWVEVSLESLLTDDRYSGIVVSITSRILRAATMLLAEYREALQRQVSKEFLGELFSKGASSEARKSS